MMAAASDDGPTAITTWQGPAAPHDSVLRVIFRGPGVVRATTGAGVGLPLLVFVVTLLGLLDYRRAGATAATDNTSSSSSSLPSLARLTLPPSPSRYYNNNDVTTATSGEKTTVHSGLSRSSYGSVLPSSVPSFVENYRRVNVIALSQRDLDVAALPSASENNDRVRRSLLAANLIRRSSGRDESTNRKENIQHRAPDNRRREGRRRRGRRRRRLPDWEDNPRSKRETAEAWINIDHPSISQLSDEIHWAVETTTTRTTITTSQEKKHTRVEPNESAFIIVEDGGKTGVGLSTSKVAIVGNRSGKEKRDVANIKRGRSSKAAITDHNDNDNNKRFVEREGTVGGFRDSIGPRWDASVIVGNTDISGTVAASLMVNNDDKVSNFNNNRDKIKNNTRKYSNKRYDGVDNENEGFTVTTTGIDEKFEGTTTIGKSVSDEDEAYGADESGVVEWWTTSEIAGPMTARSYPQGETTGVPPGRSWTQPRIPAVVNGTRNNEGPLERRTNNEENANATRVKVTGRDKDDNETTETTSSTQVPPTTQDTSMEALSASGYIVSVVLVLLVGALVGVLATVSHHLHHHRRPLAHPGGPASIIRDHHRHHHRRHHHYQHHHSEETPASLQRRLLLQDHRGHPATPMLSVSAGMEVGSGGHGGLGGGLEGGPVVGGGGGGPGGDGMQEAMVAAARDRAIRAGSVRQDLALDLPPRLQLPDGEERPYGAHTTLHLRDPEQESEIYQKCVRPPPNRTVFDSESPPPYRSQSALLDAPDRIVRCHSAGSSLLRVFRKFPSAGGSTPAVVVPPSRRPTLSSYSESSGNLSNLSSLTVVPCESDETNHHRQHV